ncbi:MAG: hypothetical protein KF905_13330 [Flavobacteriales bacterium]|nr:hypothetical protein [Flavobacteriales bacterium]
MRSILPLGLLLLANTVQAQDQPTLPDPQHGYFGRPYFENSSDSAEFMDFHAGLQWNETVTALDTTSRTYKLVWRENQHGGLRMVSRGNGSTLVRSTGTVRVGPMHDEGHFRTASGKHGILIAWETPCGMICRTASYYVEE